METLESTFQSYKLQKRGAWQLVRISNVNNPAALQGLPLPPHGKFNPSGRSQPKQINGDKPIRLWVLQLSNKTNFDKGLRL